MTRSLSVSDIGIIRRCLQATVEGTFFPDYVFQTLMGLDREAVRTVYAAWPHQTVDQQHFRLAVVGAMNNLLGYPHRKEDELMTYVPEGRDAIRKVLDRFVALNPRS